MPTSSVVRSHEKVLIDPLHAVGVSVGMAKHVAAILVHFSYILLYPYLYSNMADSIQTCTKYHSFFFLDLNITEAARDLYVANNAIMNPPFLAVFSGLLDIPVYKNRIHSLHVLFSLYMEFKNSQVHNKRCYLI